jgi:prepilin-type N-terminal cleavage/methylation domain-containing protein
VQIDTERKMKRKNNHERGFTMVEMAIVMVIFGLLASVFLFAVKLYRQEAVNDHTNEALQMTRSALREYLSLHTAYPCPADPSTPAGDSTYGLEVDCDITKTPPSEVATPTGRGGRAVWVGAVPFQTLINAGLNVKYKEKHAFDGWGNKLRYAVTMDLTEPGKFNLDNGGIDIIDERDRTILDEPGTAHVAIISHGPNGVGAWTRNGVRVEACPAVLIAPPPLETAFPKNEIENCHATNATFLSGLRIEKNHSYNDDITVYFNHDVSNFWTQVPGNNITNTNTGNVGLGTPEPKEKLHALGDIRATKMESDQYCDPSNISTCMTPDILAGNHPQMTCTEQGAYVIGVSNNRVICKNPYPEASNIPAGFKMMCDPGEVVEHINSTTGVVCKPRP